MNLVRTSLIFGGLLVAACGAETTETYGVQQAALSTTVVGDANGDGKVSSTDAGAILRYLNGNTLNPFDIGAADADGDGDVDQVDVDLIAELLTGTLPSLICPTYHGAQSFDPWKEPAGPYETYSSQHYTVYSSDPINSGNVATVLANMEACYALQAKATPEWTSRVETQTALGTSTKTIAFLRGNTCGAGCGNQYRVETTNWIFADPSAIGNRETMWVPYYEQQRGGGKIYAWYDYLFYEPANTDWNSAFAHSMAITCSEAIGAGTHHNNVTWVNSALPQWINQPAQQSWVDILSSGSGNFLRQDGETQGINDLFGAMLAELYRQYGVEYFNALTTELQRSGAYPTVTSAQTQACNFVSASDVVTGGKSHALLVDSWRFPSNCGATLSASLEVNSAWAEGYCAKVTVSNASDHPTSTWTVAIDLKGASVSTVWEASATYADGVMTAQSLSHNAVVEASGSMTFGFCATTNTGEQAVVVGIK